MSKNGITHFGQLKNLSTLVRHLEKKVDGWAVDSFTETFVSLVTFIGEHETEWIPLSQETNSFYYPCYSGVYLPLDDDFFYTIYAIQEQEPQ